MSSFPVYFLQLTTRELESYSISQQEKAERESYFGPSTGLNGYWIITLQILSPVGSRSPGRKHIIKIRHGEGVKGCAEVHLHSSGAVEEVQVGNGKENPVPNHLIQSS